MEGLARLVAESMARHGVDTPVDHRRLQWSRWFRCESSLDLLHAPSQPGLFAVAEELAAPGEIAAAGGRRMLAVFQVLQADDLGMALARLLAPNCPLKERIAGGRRRLVADALRPGAGRGFFRQRGRGLPDPLVHPESGSEPVRPCNPGLRTCDLQPPGMQL